MSFTAAELTLRYESILELANSAGTSIGQWEEVLQQYNSLRAYQIGEGARCHFRFSQNVADLDAKAALDFFYQEIAPVCDHFTPLILKQMANAPIQDHWMSQYGRAFVQGVLEFGQIELNPVNTELREKIRIRCEEYTELTGKGTVIIQGQEMNLTRARSLLDSSDASLRRDAYNALGNWRQNHQGTLEFLFDQLVQLRHQQALNLGHASFVQLGYLRMGRMDYGPTEIKTFRSLVREYFVPLYKNSLADQKKALGTSTLKAWDRSFDLRFAIPDSALVIDHLLKGARRVCQEVSPRFNELFQKIIDDGRIDLENRPGKAVGGFCIVFPDERKVGIFCNSTGSAHDVGTLMHELGHAFQALKTQDQVELVDLRWGTADHAEILSIGMEYFSRKHLHHFLGQENSTRYQQGMIRDRLSMICYCCVVDEFQHWVYANPTSGISARNSKWEELLDTYTPGIDYSDTPEFKGTGWMQQLHIFELPFYYIDYAIAEFMALQLSWIADRDEPLAFEKYFRLCELGGSKTFYELMKEVGLRLPFEESLAKNLAQDLADSLGARS